MVSAIVITVVVTNQHIILAASSRKPFPNVEDIKTMFVRESDDDYDNRCSSHKNTQRRWSNIGKVLRSQTAQRMRQIKKWQRSGRRENERRRWLSEGKWLRNLKSRPPQKKRKRNKRQSQVGAIGGKLLNKECNVYSGKRCLARLVPVILREKRLEYNTCIWLVFSWHLPPAYTCQSATIKPNTLRYDMVGNFGKRELVNAEMEGLSCIEAS